MKHLIRIHPLKIYLVFQVLTIVTAGIYIFAIGQTDSSWRLFFSVWITLALVNALWTQLAWAPCWEAGDRYGLPILVRIIFMALIGGAICFPLFVLSLVHDRFWYFFAVFSIPYGLAFGLLGGAILGTWEYKTFLRQSLPGQKQ